MLKQRNRYPILILILVQALKQVLKLCNRKPMSVLMLEQHNRYPIPARPVHRSHNRLNHSFRNQRAVVLGDYQVEAYAEDTFLLGIRHCSQRRDNQLLCKKDQLLKGPSPDLFYRRSSY